MKNKTMENNQAWSHHITPVLSDTESYHVFISFLISYGT